MEPTVAQLMATVEQLRMKLGHERALNAAQERLTEALQERVSDLSQELMTARLRFEAVEDTVDQTVALIGELERHA